MMRTSAKVSLGFYVAGALMLMGLFILSRTFDLGLHFATKSNAIVLALMVVGSLVLLLNRKK
jgi:hypothetical protein